MVVYPPMPAGLNEKHVARLSLKSRYGFREHSAGAKKEMSQV